jgi:hypothetical protein
VIQFLVKPLLLDLQPHWQSLNLGDFCLEDDSIAVILALHNPTDSWLEDCRFNHRLSFNYHVLFYLHFCVYYVAYWAAVRVHSNYIPTYFPSPPSFPICSDLNPPSPLWCGPFCLPITCMSHSFFNEIFLKKKKKSHLLHFLW